MDPERVHRCRAFYLRVNNASEGKVSIKDCVTGASAVGGGASGPEEMFQNARGSIMFIQKDGNVLSRRFWCQ